MQTAVYIEIPAIHLACLHSFVLAMLIMTVLERFVFFFFMKIMHDYTKMNPTFKLKTVRLERCVP